MAGVFHIKRVYYRHLSIRMAQFMYAPLMPVTAEEMRHSQRINYLSQKASGYVRLLSLFCAEVEVALQRNVVRCIVSDEDVQGAAGDEGLGFLMTGFFIGPPVSALGPVLVVDAERAT